MLNLNKIIIPTLVIVSYILTGCSNNKNPELKQEDSSTKISVLNSKIDTLTDLKNLFIEEKVYLKVPSSQPMGMIGLIYDVDKDENFYLASTSEVYKFTRSGEYVGTLNRVGRGPGEYIGIDAICLDTSNNLYVFDFMNKVINIYNENFNFVHYIAQESEYTATNAIVENEELFVHYPLDRDKTIYVYDLGNYKFIRSFGKVDSLYLKYQSNLGFGNLSIYHGNSYYMPTHKSIIDIYYKHVLPKRLYINLQNFIEIYETRESFREKRKYSFILRFDIFQNLFFIQARHPNEEYPLKGTYFDIVSMEGKVIKEQLLFSEVFNIKKVSDKYFMSVRYDDASNDSQRQNPHVFLYSLKKQIP